MKLYLPLVFMLMLSSCTTMRATQPPADARWLTGTWLEINEPGDESLIGCNSGLPIRYRADGTYSLFEDSEGIWRLAGDRLTETATEAYDTVDPDDVAIGHPSTSRIERVSAGEMRKILDDQSRLTMMRCPDAL